LGKNRTGIDTSPIDSQAMVDEAMHAPPSSAESDGAGIGQVREDYAATSLPVGSVAPPTTLKGVVKVAVEMMRGKKPAILFDKLGERLAFERSSTRLYEALVAKLDARGTWQNGPTRADLLEFLEEELAHFQLLARTVKYLGADPTVQSPSADLAGVESAGLVQVLTDPRTDLAQCLHAILLAELADHEGWVTLIRLADDLGHSQMAQDFRHALAEEETHLQSVRAWLSAHATLEAKRDVEQPS
jgi:hypothetical protein